MTCDERLEALLNRAGQTISDLPQGDGKHLIYDKELRKGADAAQRAWHGIGEGYVDIVDDLHMHQDYILHLTDVIDRMEEALYNVVRQRDWLRTKVCFVCWHINEDMPGTCDPEECANASIPEGWCADWWVDDDGL